MSFYTCTVFLEADASVRASTTPVPLLRVEPDGRYGAGTVTFQFADSSRHEDVLAFADRFLETVTAWRGELARGVEEQRTASEELEAARAEITRLKAEAGESDE